MIFVKSTNVVFWYDYFTFFKKKNQCKIAHLSQPFFSSLKHIKKSYIYTTSLTDCSIPMQHSKLWWREQDNTEQKKERNANRQKPLDILLL